MRASVIIPTRDRTDTLATCLESLTTQTLPQERFEVLVVDNGSKDGTAQVVARFANRLNVRLLVAPVPGLHEGRHAGLRAATTGVLMYADDDIVAEPTWVEAVVDSFEDPAVAMVGGNNLPLFETEPPEWLRLWWAEPVYKGYALGYLSILDFGDGRFVIDPGYVWGCNFSIRRSALQAAGGFHPDGLPSDLIRFRGDGETHVSRFARDSGWRVVFDSAASVRHRVPASRMTQEYFVHRAFAQGVSDSYGSVRRRGSAASRWLGSAAASRARTALRAARERWRALGSGHYPGRREMLEVRLATLRAWSAGYAWHQTAVLEDASLLQWVLRENYLP